jgi:hypothetical protein
MNQLPVQLMNYRERLCGSAAPREKEVVIIA